MLNRIAVIALLLVCGCNNAPAELTAPDKVEAGRLAVIQSSESASWAIYPQSYRDSYYIADNGQTLIFASPVKGVVTIIAATPGATHGEPIVISEHTLYNGDGEPEPKPEPDKDSDSLEAIIDNANVDGATAADYAALANSFTAAVQAIANNSVTTPAGARETFRAVWLREAARTNAAAIDTFSPLLTVISNKVDNASLQTVKRDYTAIINALRAKGRVGNARQ